MAEVYVDPTNGTDAGGTAGTSGDPYASIQYAVDNYASWDSTGGNTIYLANTSADVISTSIDLDTSLASLESPLVIEGWDNGGSITATLPNGQTVTAGEIDGNDAVLYLFDVNTAYVTLKNLKLHNSTSNTLFLGTYSGCINCEIYNGTARGIVLSASGGFAINCLVRDISSATLGGIYGGAVVTNNEIKACSIGIYAATVGGFIKYNLIHDIEVVGIRLAQDSNFILNNTIDGIGANSDGIGIDMTQSSVYEQTKAINNLVTNFSGVSGVGIKSNSTNPPAWIGNNAFYNNTTNEDLATTPAYAPANVTESSDPYVDSSTDDFSLTTGTNSEGASILTNADISNPDNIGYYQDYSSGGGGGSSEHSYVF